MDADEFIAFLARKYSRNSMLDYEDWIQEGRITVFMASKKYKARNDASFETYIRACIKNRFIKLMLSEKRRRQRISVYADRIYSQINWHKSIEVDGSMIATAEKAIPAQKMPIWEKYKELEGRRGALSEIARLHGKTREWARRQMDGIFALMRQELKKQAGKNAPNIPAGEK